MIPEVTSIYLTHAINCMIRTKRFPEVMKITRILPLTKPKKPKNLPENQRPIANLHVFEKVIEKYMKEELMKYLEENEIILKQHHGGLPGHSTLTAKTVLDYLSSKAIDEDNLAILISMDLSSTFDCIDHQILLKKLEYYRIREGENHLMATYLANRVQYTQIQTKKSKISLCQNCSVIQGSILSGLLYILYTNEVPILDNLLDNQEFIKKNLDMDKIDRKDIKQETVNFVDDSNTVIQFKDPNKANELIDIFFKVLRLYYNTMKLKLNIDKLHT